MNEEQSQPGSTAPNSQDELLKNLKAEFNRKQENTSSQLTQLQQQMAELATVITSSRSTKAPKQEDIPDPLLDREGYERYVEQKMEQRVDSKLQTMQRQQAELGSLVSNYPELQDGNSDLTKAALSVYNGLSAAEKSSPTSYRLAVQQAAADLGILPVTKRNKVQQPENEGDFSVSGSSNTKKPSKKDNTEVDSKTIEFAKLLGRDVNDPKVLEGLKKAAGRKKWGKFQGKGDY